MFTYLFDGFLRRVFSLLRVDRILYIYNALASRHRFFLLSKILSASSPGVLAWDSCPLTATSSSWHKTPFTATSVPKLIFFTPISADGRKELFPLWDSSQSFGFYLILLLSGDSLGLLYVPIPHSLPIRSQNANICWFPFWPGFVTSGLTYITIPLLTVILWRPANSNTRDSRNSLFLFSQWETTWHYDIEEQCVIVDIKGKALSEIRTHVLFYLREA